MESVEIKWDEGVTRFDDISSSSRQNLDQKGFYAILGARFDKETSKWKELKLLYIGQAFDQTLRQRIPQKHPGYECILEYRQNRAGSDIVVMIGVIGKTNAERITQELFDDIECCLICCNKPLCNMQCKESYGGRAIQIVNTGDFIPLRKECTCTPS